MKSYVVRAISEHKGAPRVWLDGVYPDKAGFKSGLLYTIDIDSERKKITLKVDENGTHIVSKKIKKDELIPVIDLNSKKVLSLFEGMRFVRVIFQQNVIVILSDIVEVKKSERLKRLNNKLKCGEQLSIGSLSHGGGILTHALHHGFKLSGINSCLAFANEIREELISEAEVCNDSWDENTISLAAPMQALVLDSWAMSKLPKVECLEAGLPCEAMSLAGRAKNGTAIAEAHDEVGHLVVPFIQIINQVNPVVVIFENVKSYQNSGSMWILRHTLRDMGYVVKEAIFNSTEFNELERRERLCLVAVTEGIEFNFDCVKKPEPLQRRLGEILEHFSDDDAVWKEFDGLKRHEEKHVEKGNGFKMQVFDEDSDHVNTLGKGYGKIRATEGKVINKRTGLMRQFTVSEHAKLKGIPKHLTGSHCMTTAHEMLGQSICYAPFVAIGKVVGESLLNSCLIKNAV